MTGVGAPVQPKIFASNSAALLPSRSPVLHVGKVLLILGWLCCGAASALAQDSRDTDHHYSSWTTTTDLKSDNRFATKIPVRTTESHTENGNLTVDKHSVQIRGMDGHLSPYQEIETETLQVDDTTVRTTTRTFGRNINGGRALVQVTEEEKHLLPGGDSNVQRITFNPDVNGKLKAVQHEVTEMKVISDDAEETNTTVMLPNINGGLAPAFKTRELRRRGADGRTESEKTTLLADGAGKWEVGEKRQLTISQEGANQTVEERVFQRDGERNLVEISRTDTKESESVSGEKRKTIETYSIDVPGASRDGKLHLVERATIAQRTTTIGEQVTDKTVEEVNPGNPSSGLRVSVLVNDRMVPIPSGEQSALVIRKRDANGRFDIVAVDTTISDRISVLQVQEPSQKPR